MNESLEVDFRKPIPLFPLPNCVLLPGVTVPLHIFEPRYKQMVKDVLDSKGLIAMAMFEGETWKESYGESPLIRPHVCLGYIVTHHRYDNGRYDLMLYGVCRARIVKEVTHEPYRKAILQPTESRDAPEIDLSAEREELEHLLEDPMLSQLMMVSAVKNWLSREVPTPMLIDLTIMTVCENADRRYTMLAESDVNARFAFLEKELRDTRETVRMASKIRPPEVTEEAHLN